MQVHHSCPSFAGFGPLRTKTSYGTNVPHVVSCKVSSQVVFLEFSEAGATSPGSVNPPLLDNDVPGWQLLSLLLPIQTNPKFLLRVPGRLPPDRSEDYSYCKFPLHHHGPVRNSPCVCPVGCLRTDPKFPLRVPSWLAPDRSEIPLACARLAASGPIRNSPCV